MTTQNGWTLSDAIVWVLCMGFLFVLPAYVALLMSSKGLLIEETHVPRTARSQAFFRCTYWTGTQTFVREYWSDGGCQRMVHISSGL